MTSIRVPSLPILFVLIASSALPGGWAAVWGSTGNGGGGAGSAAAAGPAGDLGTPAVTAEREAAGEPCAVCGRDLGPGEKAYQFRGRWIPLHDGQCAETFRAGPDVILARVQPRGALFAESEATASALWWGWFLAGAYVLLGLMCGALCVHLAWPRRRPASFWFAMGMLFNILAVAALAASSSPVERMPGRLGKIPVTSPPATCPGCGAANHPAAASCAGCGRSLDAAYEPEARRSGRP